MGPLAAQLLLESLLMPFALASVIMILARGSDRGLYPILAPVLAIGLAVGAAYLLIFGWPLSTGISARTKIMLSCFAGFFFGFAIHMRFPGSRIALIAGAIALPIWIGVPALQQGRPESAFLLLPILLGLAVPFLIGRDIRSTTGSVIPMLLVLALSISAIAVFAKALSFAQLSLALGAALLAILMIGRAPLPRPAALMAAAMIQSLFATMLLYTDASLAALVVLGAVIGADRLARLTFGGTATAFPTLRFVVFSVLPAASAIVIARIDAGEFSIY